MLNRQEQGYGSGGAVMESEKGNMKKNRSGNAAPKAIPAPLNKRTFAFLLDWYLGSALSAVPAGILWNMQTGETAINTDITLFEAPWGLIAGLLGLLAGAVYYYLIPLRIWPGQTLGKRLMRIRITGCDDRLLPAGRLAVRQVAGIMILEGSFMITGQYVTGMLRMLTAGAVGSALNYLMLGVFLISVWMVFKKGQAVHDLWVDSKVVILTENI